MDQCGLVGRAKFAEQGGIWILRKQGLWPFRFSLSAVDSQCSAATVAAGAEPICVVVGAEPVGPPVLPAHFSSQCRALSFLCCRKRDRGEADLKSGQGSADRRCGRGAADRRCVRGEGDRVLFAPHHRRPPVAFCFCRACCHSCGAGGADWNCCRDSEQNENCVFLLSSGVTLFAKCGRDTADRKCGRGEVSRKCGRGTAHWRCDRGEADHSPSTQPLTFCSAPPLQCCHNCGRSGVDLSCGRD